MASKVQLTGGAFQDSEGNTLANGYLKFRLSQDGSVSGTGNICSGVEITINLDADGNIVASPAQYIWGNDSISPVNTYYRVTGYTAQGQPSWGPNNQQVVGTGTFDVGTWVPNTVISWTPSPQPLELETNGTPNGSQALLNLKSGTNVTLTDDGSGGVTIAASGGGSFSGSGAFMFGPGLRRLTDVFGQWSSSIGANSVNGTNTANQVTVYLFQLDVAITISKVSVIASNNAIGVHGFFGIYSHAGGKILDGGQFNALTSPQTQTNNITPVTLQPGVYWHAQASDSASSAATFEGITLTSSAGSDSIPIYIKNATRCAVAANVLSGGVLPATLGALTPFTPISSDGDGCCAPLYE